MEEIIKSLHEVGIHLPDNSVEAIELKNQKLWIIIKSEIFFKSTYNTVNNYEMNLKYDENKNKIIQELNNKVELNKESILLNINKKIDYENINNIYIVFVDNSINKVDLIQEKQTKSSKQNSLDNKEKIDEKNQQNPYDIEKTKHNLEKIKNEKTKNFIPQTKHVIAICSGKGGVGKSTVTVALANSLTELGYNVGIADVDIYGPSIPIIMNILLDQQPEYYEGFLIPILKNKIQVMSVSMLIDEALLWRGPMAVKMLHNILLQTYWGKNRLGGIFGRKPLDFLLIDTPPGTGDIHLSLTSQYHISGAIMITTPCEIAMIQTSKSISLMKRMGVEILGVIENMQEESTNLVSQWTEDKQQLNFLGSIGKKRLKEDLPFIANKIVNFYR